MTVPAFSCAHFQRFSKLSALGRGCACFQRLRFDCDAVLPPLPRRLFKAPPFLSDIILAMQHPPCFKENLFALIGLAGEGLFSQSFTWTEAGKCNTYRVKPDSLGGFVYLFPNKSSCERIPRIYYCLNVSFMLLLRNRALPESFNFISLLCVCLLSAGTMLSFL